MSAIRDLLFHVSWIFLLAAAIGGVGAFIYGNRRLDKKIQRAGIAVFLLAVLVGSLRLVFPSDREKMETRTRDLVKSVESGDWNTMSRLIDTNTSISYRSQTYPAGRASIVNLAKSARDVNGLKSVHVLGMESDQTQTLITVSMEVYSTQDRTADRPVPSSWQFDYEQSGDNWVLDKITLIRVGRESDNQNFNPFGN